MKRTRFMGRRAALVESLVEAIQRLSDCIYETNQLLTQINNKIDEIMEVNSNGNNELS